jgi:hypothetical protein
MRKIVLGITALVMTLSFNGCASGQSQGGGMGMSGMGGKNSNRNIMLGNNETRSGGGMASYKKSTFMTVDVTVTKVGENESNPDGGVGLHLYSKTQSGKSYTLHVAPQFYIDENNIKFSVGEKLKASGSFFVGGSSVGDSIYVASIFRKSANKTMQFRDPNSGEGVWKSYMKKKMQKSMREKMRAKMKKKMQAKMQKDMKEENSKEKQNQQ